MGSKEKTGARRRIGVLILSIAVCVSLCGCGEKKPRMYRVGILSGAETFDNIAAGFKTKMAELGYIDGKNILYDFKRSNDPSEEQGIIRKFTEGKVDLILAFPTDQALKAKLSAKEANIPVVFAMAGIEGGNLVKSVREPGGNITGVRFPGSELTVKRLEFLRELAPDARRVYLIYDIKYPNTAPALKGLRSVALAWGIRLVEDPVKNTEELRAALNRRSASADIGIDAILIMPDLINNSPDGFGAILEFAKKHKLPIGGGLDFTVELGAAFSFVPDNVEQGMLAATLADKIFRGTPAGTIPVITPNARLRLNYKVIQELGLKVPEGLLSMADEIIR